MLLVASVRRTDVPAITHVDNSARIQSVNREQNQRYYDIIRLFTKNRLPGNNQHESFNVRGEPIVMSPKDAFNTFFKHLLWII